MSSLKGKYPFEKSQKYVVWSTMVVQYLKGFRADYFLAFPKTPSWSSRDKNNHQAVYAFPMIVSSSRRFEMADELGKIDFGDDPLSKMPLFKTGGLDTIE